MKIWKSHAADRETVKNNKSLLLIGGFLLASQLVFSPVIVRAASTADEMSLMLTRDTFFSSSTPSSSGLHGSSFDQSMIDQQGDDNFSRSEQASSRHGNIDVQQQGSMNAAGAFQADGIGNNVQILQQGNANYLSATQSGSANEAQLLQYNSNNRLELDQRNGNNTADITQNGNSILKLDQGGGSNANITVDAGNPYAPTTFTLIQAPGDSVTLHIID